MININEHLPGLRPVIFDIDGTLVDSNDAHALAWVDSLAEAGHEVTFARVRPLIGMGGDKVLPELVGMEEDSPEGKRLAQRRGEIFQQRYLPAVQGLPGAQELVSHLASQGHSLAVASSARKEELEALLRCAGVERLIKQRTSSSDADQSKPDPDIIKAALDNLGCAASEAVMVGDTPYDIEAARRAGVETIAFRSGGWGDADLSGAIAIYDGPAHLRREYRPVAVAAASCPPALKCRLHIRGPPALKFRLHIGQPPSAQRPAPSADGLPPTADRPTTVRTAPPPSASRLST